MERLRSSGPSGRRCGCRNGNHLAGGFRPVHGGCPLPPVGYGEERPAVWPAEDAREAAPVKLDGLQHLAALGHANAMLVSDIRVPHRPVSIQANAVRMVAGYLGPYPPVRQ